MSITKAQAKRLRKMIREAIDAAYERAGFIARESSVFDFIDHLTERPKSEKELARDLTSVANAVAGAMRKNRSKKP